jgi:aryl-alcohol dehydrogenase-like predicted oxidoreductase
VDTATNYPINRQAADFRAAERILADWLLERDVEDLQVMVKVGSVNNLMTPEHLLSPSFLQLCRQEYQALFGPNLHTLMIHWDNRKDTAAIRASLATLAEWQSNGLTIGLSGIRHPEVYAQLLAELAWQNVPLQLKHNLIYSDYPRYAPIHERVRPIAYGLTGGGLKLVPQEDGESLRARGGTADHYAPLLARLRTWLAQWKHAAPAPTSMNQIGMLYALYHPAIEQVLLGGSRPAHLEDSFHWYEQLQQHDYTAAYRELHQLAHDG